MVQKNMKYELPEDIKSHVLTSPTLIKELKEEAIEGTKYDINVEVALMIAFTIVVAIITLSIVLLQTKLITKIFELFIASPLYIAYIYFAYTILYKHKQINENGTPAKRIEIDDKNNNSE